MATARKLPSGAYRALVFKGYSYVDGRKKRDYESFTAPTKDEAELMAAQWRTERKERKKNLTVKAALEAYISAKENVLSPSTIRGYNAILSRFEKLDDVRIRDLTSLKLQEWISEMSGKLSYKSVKNTYGLLTAALALHGVNKQFNVQLPARIKKDYYLPSDDDIIKALSACEGTELWIAIMLARYYSLRRSEICALDSTDLSGNVLTIQKGMVFNKNNEWIVKPFPKTYDSFRQLVIAEPLLSVLSAKSGRLVNYNPNALTNQFAALLRSCKIPEFSLHTLRHAFASSAALLGVPDFYTARLGGWRQGSSVLKEIYQNVNKEELLKQQSLLNESMQHDLQHENEKPL